MGKTAELLREDPVVPAVKGEIEGGHDVAGGTALDSVKGKQSEVIVKI